MTFMFATRNEAKSDFGHLAVFLETKIQQLNLVLHLLLFFLNNVMTPFNLTQENCQNAKGED